jgi:outer membrane protein OmpA-like peptidoglycan-associated protein
MERSFYIIALFVCFATEAHGQWDTVPYAPKNLEYLNSDLDEYFPSITADGKIMSVTRSLQSDYDTQEDLYYSTNLNGIWLPLMPLTDLNTNGNEGSQSFSADGRYMFFVSCNRPRNYGSCDIYYSINTNGSWSYPLIAPYPVNTREWESNPVLSATGDELFFVSSRKPGLGGKDIWRCDVKIVDGGLLEFSNPKNLGKPVNTEKDDFAPFIHADNQTLYFASNGHAGLGGSDIFVSRRENGIFSEPKNIGYPINTKENEFGIVVAANGNKAYISSWNRENPNRRLDIYEFELYPDIAPKTMKFIVGNVFDAVTLKKLDAVVEIFDYASQNTLSKSLSDKKSGGFTVFLPDKGEFGLNVSRKDYLFYSSKISFVADTLKIALQPLQKGEKVILNNIFFDFNSAELQNKSEKEIDKIVDFMQKNPTVTIVISGHTDNAGDTKFNQTLSENRALSVQAALVAKGIAGERLSVRGFGFSQPIAPNNTDEGREKNRRVELMVN